MGRRGGASMTTAEAGRAELRQQGYFTSEVLLQSCTYNFDILSQLLCSGVLSTPTPHLCVPISFMRAPHLISLLRLGHGAEVRPGGGLECGYYHEWGQYP